jgi:hypothetical protein
MAARLAAAKPSPTDVHGSFCGHRIIPQCHLIIFPAEYTEILLTLAWLGTQEAHARTRPSAAPTTALSQVPHCTDLSNCCNLVLRYMVRCWGSHRIESCNCNRSPRQHP